jgi:4,5-dihydroxyphthalate decarboxylase
VISHRVVRSKASAIRINQGRERRPRVQPSSNQVMSKVPLTFACGLYDRVVALANGTVPVEGVDLNFINIDSPREIFDRMSAAQEFDASEYSSSEFIARFSAGRCPFVAIPVFPSRAFRHGFIVINRKFIRKPEDLQSKRIGLPMYTMTASIFIKGLLQDEYGVDLSTIEWVEGQINGGEAHGAPTTMPLVKPVAIEKNRTGKSLSALLEDGEIHATIGTGLPHALGKNPDIIRLFPNYREVERDYFQRTGIFPIMHLVAIRRDVYERYPFVASSLYEALNAAKELARLKMRAVVSLRYMLPWMGADIEEIDRVFEGEAFPYGIEPNRRTLETLMRYLHEQGLIAQPVKIDDLFVPSGRT